MATAAAAFASTGHRVRAFRIISIWLGILLVVLAAATVSPVVQTWWVNRALANHGIHASIGSFWATPGRVEVSDLRWENDGVVLTVPEADADVAVKAALLEGRWDVTHLVAKNWALDFSGRPEPAGAPTPAATDATPSAPAAAVGEAAGPTPPASAPQPVAGGRRAGTTAVFSALALPARVSVARAEVEGDLVLALPGTDHPTHVHTVLSGGNVRPGQTAEFACDAAGMAGESHSRIQSAVAHGKLTVAIGTDGQIGRIEFGGTVASPEQRLPEDLTVMAAVTPPTDAARATYDLQVHRGRRSPLHLTAHADAAAGFTGTWQLDIASDELSLLFGDARVPALAASGHGTFSVDTNFAQVGAAGEMTAHLRDWAPFGLFAGAPNLAITARFRAHRSAGTIAIDSLQATAAGAAPFLELATVQPITFDEASGAVRARDASADAARVTVRAMPLAWLPPFAGRFTCPGGQVSGELGLRGRPDGFVLTATKPVVANDVSVARSGRVVATGLTVSAPLTVTFAGPSSWEVRTGTLDVAAGQKQLASMVASFRPASDPYQTAIATGHLEADLDQWRAAKLPGLSWLNATRAAADFKATFGGAADLDAKLKITGHVPGTEVSGQILANIEDYRAVTLKLPLTITTPTQTSSLSIDGSWTETSDNDRIDVEVSGNAVDAAALRGLLTEKTRAALIARTTHAESTNASRGSQAARPAWGRVVGRARLTFGSLLYEGKKLEAVEANFSFSPESIQLHGGRARYNPIDLTKKNYHREDLERSLEPISTYFADGSINWDASAPTPYTLKLSAGVDVIEGARIFGVPAGKEPPAVEGRWAVSETVTSTGRTVADLWSKRHEAYHLTSTGGGLRLLGTSVGDALPDAATPVSDAAAQVGSAVTWLFGVKRGALDRENKLSQGTEAVLNFTYAVRELPYDTATVDAVRAPDGALQLTRVEIVAPKLRLAGSGAIADAPGPIGDRPLSLAFTLSIRGAFADQLKTTGLLSDAKQGEWTPFKDPVRITGTLHAPNKSLWHDQLARAAVSAEAHH